MKDVLLISNEKASVNEQYTLVLLDNSSASDDSCMENWFPNWSLWWGPMWCLAWCTNPQITWKCCYLKRCPFSTKKRNTIKYSTSYDTCDITYQQINKKAYVGPKGTLQSSHRTYMWISHVKCCFSAYIKYVYHMQNVQCNQKWIHDQHVVNSHLSSEWCESWFLNLGTVVWQPKPTSYSLPQWVEFAKLS